MKLSLLCPIFALLACATVHRAKGAEEVPTTVEKVTLFLDGALVKRTCRVDLPAGETTLLFTGLSPRLDARSLLIRNSNNSYYDGVVILEVECLYGDTGTLTRAERLRADKELRAAIRERDRNREGQRAAKSEIYRLAEEWYEHETDRANQNAPKLIDRDSKRMYEEAIRRHQLEKRLPKLEERRDRLTQEFGRAARQEEQPIVGIRVKVRTSDPGEKTLLLSYYLREAGWRPRYEVRSEGLDEPVLLVYKADIRQHTGEEWRDAELTLSTSRPVLDDAHLELQPYRLDPDLASPEYWLHALYETISGFIYEEGTRRPIAGATVQGSGGTIRTTSDRDGRFTIAMPRGSAILQFKAEGMVPEEFYFPEPTINVEMKPTTSEMTERRVKLLHADDFGPQPEVFSAKPHCEWKLRRPCTVLPDGNPVSVEIDSFEFPATYRHRSTPKIDPDAFLQVETTGWAQLGLPEGEAEVYFENTRMGSCRLAPAPTNDTLRIPLGRNRGLVIERKRDRNCAQPRTPGADYTLTINWQLSIRNTCGQTAELHLCDQIPISDRDDIAVTAEETSGGTLDPETGLVTWDLRLEPGACRELDLRYRVDFRNGDYFFVE